MYLLRYEGLSMLFLLVFLYVYIIIYIIMRFHLEKF
jgi:hypothetical protein